MANQKALSASDIRYLLTLRRLGWRGKGVRCVELAGALGYAKPSVHNKVDALIAQGWVQRDPFGVCRLTRPGAELARRYSRYYEAVEAHLSRHFPGNGDVSAAACALLAEFDEDDLKGFCEAQGAAGER